MKKLQQDWQAIAAQGYQAIFETEQGELIVQQTGFIGSEYDVAHPSGAISEHISPAQVSNILNEWNVREVRRGNDNE